MTERTKSIKTVRRRAAFRPGTMKKLKVLGFIFITVIVLQVGCFHAIKDEVRIKVIAFNLSKEDLNYETDISDVVFKDNSETLYRCLNKKESSGILVYEFIVINPGKNERWINIIHNSFSNLSESSSDCLMGALKDIQIPEEKKLLRFLLFLGVDIETGAWKKAYDELVNAKMYEGQLVGYASRVSSLFAAKEILHYYAPKKDIENLLKSSNPIAVLYALDILQPDLNPEQKRELLKEMIRDHRKVEMLHFDLVTIVRVGDYFFNNLEDAVDEKMKNWLIDYLLQEGSELNASSKILREWTIPQGYNSSLNKTH